MKRQLSKTLESPLVRAYLERECPECSHPLDLHGIVGGCLHLATDTLGRPSQTCECTEGIATVYERQLAAYGAWIREKAEEAWQAEMVDTGMASMDADSDYGGNVDELHDDWIENWLAVEQDRLNELRTEVNDA